MKTKTSTVVLGGTTPKKVSPSGLVPAVAAGRGPSDLWKDVKPDEIGTGYEPVSGVFDDEPKKARVRRTTRRIRRLMDDLDRESIFKNKFVHIKGDGSKFVWFEVVPPKPKKPEPPQKRKPINYKNKLDQTTRAKITRLVDANINGTASFIMKELLPKTLSLYSAVSRVDELAQQLTDAKVEVPVGYIQAKQSMAVNLRIIRFVADQFDLTEEERKLMVLEYTRPWSQS